MDSLHGGRAVGDRLAERYNHRLLHTYHRALLCTKSSAQVLD
jgi:hypothetical protein